MKHPCKTMCEKTRSLVISFVGGRVSKPVLLATELSWWCVMGTPPNPSWKDLPFHNMASKQKCHFFVYFLCLAPWENKEFKKIKIL